MYRVARGSVFTRSILASGQEVSLAPSCRGFGITRWRQGHWEINRISFGGKGAASVASKGWKNASGEWGEVEKSDAARYRDASIGESLLACPITWLMPLIQQNHFV